MDARPLKIAISAGEASGDQQGAALLEALREIASPRPIEAWGVGGHRLRAAGVELLYDSSLLGSIGIVATLGQIPLMIRALGDMKRSIATRKPDVVVLIDAGGFNVPLARWVKERDTAPVFYYFPPSSWRRAMRAPSHEKKSMAYLTDRIVTPFPWSESNLRSIANSRCPISSSGATSLHSTAETQPEWPVKSLSDAVIRERKTCSTICRPSPPRTMVA